MYVHISIKRPSAGHAGVLAESMRRFAAAARTQPGLQLVTTLRDRESGDLVGLAIWESEDAARAAGPALAAAVENDDFDTWVAQDRSLRLTEVGATTDAH